MPKISLIIPIYNVEKYLRQCLDSVVNQTLSDIEIICIDDCSTDSSLSILEEYAKKDSRIKIIDLKENVGVAHARNVGMRKATADYIMFIDPDDWIELNTCELAYNQIEKNNNDFVLFNYKKYFEIKNKFKVNKRRIKHFLPFENESNIDLKNLDKNWISGAFCTHQIYKKSFLIDNNILFPKCKITEDALFYSMVTTHAKSMSVINKPLYNYRIRECATNLSSKHGLWSEMLKGKTLAFEFVESLNKPEIVLPHLIFYIRSVLHWFIKFERISFFEKWKFYNAVRKIIKNIEKKYNLSQEKDADIHIDLYKTILQHGFLYYRIKIFFNTNFNIKESKDKKHKIITIFGLRIKLRRKNFTL